VESSNITWLVGGSKHEDVNRALLGKWLWRYVHDRVGMVESCGF
jgi:hypothetical protein